MIVTPSGKNKLRRWLKAWPLSIRGEIRVEDGGTGLNRLAFVLEDSTGAIPGNRVWGPKCWGCLERHTWYLQDLMVHYKPPPGRVLVDGPWVCDKCAMRECTSCKRKVTSSTQTFRSSSLIRRSLCERCTPAPLNNVPAPEKSTIPKWRPKP